MDNSTRLYIIHTEAGMLLTKRIHGSWREIQDAYPGYKSSLGPWPADEVVEYLAGEYPKLSPSASDQVGACIAGPVETCVLVFGG